MGDDPRRNRRPPGGADAALRLGRSERAGALCKPYYYESRPRIAIAPPNALNPNSGSIRLDGR